MSDSFDSEIIKEQDKRIRELEAERDKANDALANMGLNWNALKEGSAMQLRAVRAKTIEECAQVADDCHVCLTIAKRIRALAHASTSAAACDEACDAIRAKTFEECLALAEDRAETWHTEARRMAARDLRDDLRALAQTGEK
jgi:hypothetical protein